MQPPPVQPPNADAPLVPPLLLQLLEQAPKSDVPRLSAYRECFRSLGGAHLWLLRTAPLPVRPAAGVDDEEEIIDYARALFRHCTDRLEFSSLSERVWLIYTLYVLHECQLTRPKYAIPLPEDLWPLLQTCAREFATLPFSDASCVLRRMLEQQHFEFTLDYAPTSDAALVMSGGGARGGSYTTAAGAAERAAKLRRLAAATERLGDLHALSDMRTSLQMDQLRELGTAYAQAMHECQLAAVSGGGDAEYHAAAAAAAAATSGMIQSTAANVAASASSSSAGSPAASASAASVSAGAVPLSAASAAPLRLFHRVEQHVASHDALRTRLEQESLLRTMLPSSTLHPLALQPPPVPTAAAVAAASAADAMDAPMLQSIEALQQLQQSAMEEEHKSATVPVALESSAADPASRRTRGMPKHVADTQQDAPIASPPLLIDATAILQAAAAASNHAATL